MRVDGRRPNPAVTPRVRALLALFALVLAAVSVHRLWLAQTPSALVELRGPTMGTTWSVKLVAPQLDAAGRGALLGALRARLDEIDARMSTWREDSETSRFNRHRSLEPFTASHDTLHVLRVAREISELSGGAFDVTVAPLVAAWGFGASARAPAPPPDAELADARTRVGFEKLRLDDAALHKLEPGLHVDLSAIAKGYAVDALAEILASGGHADFLVEIGGELLGRGARPDGRPWQVAIERPDARGRTPHRVIALRDRALATSGDYRDYYELDGERVSHTIDPRSGRPIRHRLASVSVLASTATRADALATALNVLGPEHGRALAEREGVAAYFIARELDGTFRAFATPAFEAPTSVP